MEKMIFVTIKTTAISSTKPAEITGMSKRTVHRSLPAKL